MVTLSTSGAVKLKAGANAPTLTGAQYEILLEKAEAFVAMQSKYDWVTNEAAIPANTREILQEATAKLAAIDTINYDMSGFTSRLEAQTMLDVLWSKVVEIINLLRDDKFRTFVQRGTTD